MTKNIKFNNAELIDKLIVMQLKQVINNKNYKEFEKGISTLVKQINLNIVQTEKKIFSAELIGLLIALSQINTFIWLTRDKIKNSNKELSKNIKVSHQLNALRNKAKNKIVRYLKNDTSTLLQTNTNKEDLKGWKYSIVED
tara:strand:+ start:167 stop:589 length:423 start_codon:yes stop_codon:yes gene_type:complete